MCLDFNLSWMTSMSLLKHTKEEKPRICVSSFQAAHKDPYALFDLGVKHTQGHSFPPSFRHFHCADTSIQCKFTLRWGKHHGTRSTAWVVIMYTMRRFKFYGSNVQPLSCAPDTGPNILSPLKLRKFTSRLGSCSLCTTSAMLRPLLQ